jgi:hypothetical protein
LPKGWDTEGEYMKLSHAVMMNGMTKPQGFGQESLTSVDAPCAIGGALQAVGAEQSYVQLIKKWPWTTLQNDCCPVCTVKAPSGSIIWHLNDTHAWTRAQIAAWIANVEPQEDCEAAPQVEENTVVAAIFTN